LTCLNTETGGATLLTQINSCGGGVRIIQLPLDSATKVSPMFDSGELRNELQALKGDVSRLLNTTGDGLFGASKNRAEALADQIKAALNELGDSLSEQEDHIEKFVSGRPITTLASTFALGVVVGFMLRRH
jgi:ElaB/YqjD/DUF883 family membrane-anchored ribosome-binding protein